MCASLKIQVESVLEIVVHANGLANTVAWLVVRGEMGWMKLGMRATSHRSYLLPELLYLPLKRKRIRLVHLPLALLPHNPSYLTTMLVTITFGKEKKENDKGVSSLRTHLGLSDSAVHVRSTTTRSFRKAVQWKTSLEVHATKIGLTNSTNPLRHRDDERETKEKRRVLTFE
uniref:Uncharacterized protein n=1 Tax=Vespula pensylvanica TaxID=30213 RepID=A0A834NBB5_VESPE|nr:hypothetical protein H0235_015205 [Vespula pensylvanica]